MEKKSEALNKLKSKIELLDKKIRGLFESKKNIELEIQNKNIEIEDLKKEFDKDLSEFPLNLNEKISEAKKEKNNLENSLFKIDKTLYGFYGKKPEGLYWKQVRLIHQYKKSAVGNDKLFNELQEESIEKNLNELANKIKMKLKQDNLFLNDEMKLNDLCLKVIETAISLREESFFDEKDRDEIYDISINTVLSQEEKIGKYLFVYDRETIMKFLNEQTSNTEKLQFINLQITPIKRMIDEIENTKVAEAVDNGYWSIFTRDKELAALVVEAVKTRITISKKKITEDILQDILKGLLNRLKESYIYLKTEYKAINRAIKISKEKSKEISDEEKRNDIEEKVNDKVIQTELPDVQNVSVNIRYDKVKELVSKLPIDITEKVTKVKKIGNRKWKYTEGDIFLKIHKGLGNNLTPKQKNVAIKHIQKYRTELLENKSNNKS